MPILRRDDLVQTAMGQAVAGAQVYYLTQPANTTALTPLASVYSDLTGTPAANPQITDGFGHAVAYLDNSQLYTIVWVSPIIGKIVYTDQNVGNAVSSLSVSQQVPSGTIDGTNVTFAISITSNPVLLLIQFNSALLINGIGFTQSFASGVVTIILAQAPQPASGGNPADVLNAIIFS